MGRNYHKEYEKHFEEVRINSYTKIKTTLENKGAVLLTPFEQFDNTNSRIDIKCKCGQIYNIVASVYKKQTKCPSCSIEERVSKRRSTPEYINNVIINYNLNNGTFIQWVDGIHKNNKSLLTVKDDNGYYYQFKLYVFEASGLQPKFYYKNPFTIQNLKLWLSKNEPQYTLLSDEYKSMKKLLIWKCDCGHIFEMNLDNFLQGQRCPVCRKSKGEKKIKLYLEQHDIDYEVQKKFNDLRGINDGMLSYDFALPQKNILIEYQGEYHDGNTRCQTKKDIEEQQYHDKLKYNYAKSHNIKLLEIWYWDYDNIEQILNQEIAC